jgi:hypothetical protein
MPLIPNLRRFSSMSWLSIPSTCPTRTCTMLRKSPVFSWWSIPEQIPQSGSYTCSHRKFVLVYVWDGKLNNSLFWCNTKLSFPV